RPWAPTRLHLTLGFGRAFLFSRSTGLGFGDAAVVFRRAVEKGLDRPPQNQLLRQLLRRAEVHLQSLRLGQVVVAQPRFNLELGVLLRERAHPFFDLTAAILVAFSVLQIAEQRVND